jgi:hypothetical protein
MAQGEGGGRPTVMTKETLKKLEDAYLVGATHLEASIYAGISEVTLHDYRKKNPKYSKYIEGLRDNTTLQAKINVTNSINGGNLHDSKWYLEKRDKDFTPKQKNEIDATPSLLDAIRAKRKGCNNE